MRPDPDWDRHPEPADPDQGPEPSSELYTFQPNVQINNILFPENFNLLSKILKIITLMRKVK
jgi:hypothetical protein